MTTLDRVEFPNSSGLNLYPLSDFENEPVNLTACGFKYLWDDAARAIPLAYTQPATLETPPTASGELEFSHALRPVIIR